jgi:midasin (ATPase involved in ribosome maturation)
MVGVDLLLARLNNWQHHIASASEGTSFEDITAPIAGIAARWRRLQLAGWARVIDSALENDRARAFESWYHLYSIFFGASTLDNAARLLPVVEEFLQSATIGQFEARLELLAVFGGHCGIIAAVEGNEPAEGRRWRTLEVSVGNMIAYYSQHVAAVSKELKRAVAPVQKELRVRLSHLWCCLLIWAAHGLVVRLLLPIESWLLCSRQQTI